MGDNIQGKKAILFNATLGTLIVGAGTTPLADNSWFKIAAVATTGSELPFGVGYLFKTPDAAGAITPAIGDDVYPVTMGQICKADTSFSAAPGTYEVEDDDCSEGGVTATKYDGYISYSGSVSAYLKLDDAGMSSAAQTAIMSRYFDLQTDSGAGVYTLVERNQESLLLAVLDDKDNTAATGVQEWILLKVISGTLTLDKALKASQVFNFDWNSAGGVVSRYTRITNATETVF